MSKCYYNLIDENWWTIDDDGLVWGIGKTIHKSIEEAEFWGMDCKDIEIEENYNGITMERI